MTCSSYLSPCVGESAQPAIVLSITHTCTLSSTLAERDLYILLQEGNDLTDLLVEVNDLVHKHIDFFTGLA